MVGAGVGAPELGGHEEVGEGVNGAGAECLSDGLAHRPLRLVVRNGVDVAVAELDGT